MLNFYVLAFDVTGTCRVYTALTTLHPAFQYSNDDPRTLTAIVYTVNDRPNVHPFKMKNIHLRRSGLNTWNITSQTANGCVSNATRRGERNKKISALSSM